MKLNVNLVIGIALLSSLFCFSSSFAASGKPFKKIDRLKIEKFKKQVVNQGPNLKEKFRQKKIKGQTLGIVSKDKKDKRINAENLKEQIKKDTGNIKLVMNGSMDFRLLSDELKGHGASIIRMRNNTAVVEVPIENLEIIFSEVKSIENARMPLRFYPQAVESEGVAVTGSDVFRNLTYNGGGVKIAIIDVGFKGLTAAIGNGDLPTDIMARSIDYSGNGLETDYYHGTACAEIIHDMAPGAELHLLKILYTIDILDALDYCIDNSIDIVSFSIGTFGTGPGDGTGPLDEAIDLVRAYGILPIAAAGNNGNTTIGEGAESMTLGAHWKGLFRDNETDNIHEFVAGNGDVVISNIFAAYPTTDDDGDPEDNEVSVLLRWNDWIVPDTDYDMILMEYDPETDQAEVIATSEDLQDGGDNQAPVEYISIDIPDNEDYLHYYAVSIVKASGAPNVEMELHLGGTSMFLPYDENIGPIATSESSITEPADAESVLAVGVIDYLNWTTGPQQDYCSQGPTNAWAGSNARVKPDVMGPDGVSTFTYGNSLSGDGFYGASAGTPHVAGLAALILSKYPSMTPDDLQEAIESRAIDMGDAGKDNIYGWGKIDADTDLSDIIPLSANPGGLYSVTEGNSVSLTATASSLNPNDTLTYSWDINGDNTYGDATGASLNVPWATLQGLGINDTGSPYTVKVQVSNGAAAVNSAGVNLTVTNVAPSASAGGPYSVTEGKSVTLTAIASDVNSNDVLTYSWDINGDNTYGDAAGVSPNVSWATLQGLGIDDTGSPYTVRVLVSDGTATTNSAGVDLTVTNAPGGGGGGCFISTSVAGSFTWDYVALSSIAISIVFIVMISLSGIKKIRGRYRDVG